MKRKGKWRKGGSKKDRKKRIRLWKVTLVGLTCWFWVIFDVCGGVARMWM